MYSASVSNICSALQATSAIFNGVTNSLRASNAGANPYQATAFGLYTTGVGINNSIWGNCYDKMTGTYMGTAMSNMYSTTANCGYNPFMNPFMLPTMPYYCGMPTFSGFGWYC